jgi:hypothetical protein
MHAHGGSNLVLPLAVVDDDDSTLDNTQEPPKYVYPLPPLAGLDIWYTPSDALSHKQTDAVLIPSSSQGAV